MGLVIAFIFYSYHSVSCNAGFVAIENDIANSDGCGLDWHNSDNIIIAYRWVHAVAGRAEPYLVPGG